MSWPNAYEPITDEDYEPPEEEPVGWQHDPEPAARGHEEDRVWADLREGEVWGP